MRQRHLTFSLLFLLALSSACSKAPQTAKPSQPTAVASVANSPLPNEAKTILLRLNNEVASLTTSAQSLARMPDGDHLKSAQLAWRSSYTTFNQSLTWLLGNRANAALIERNIDPLPIQPGYVDALKQWPDSGLVNDPTLELTPKTLIQQNQATDDTEVSLGFQVIQFLLWGNKDLPRKPEDFANPRRAHYLTLVTQQLAEDVHTVIQQVEQNGSDKKLGHDEEQKRLAAIKSALTNQSAWLAPMSATLAENALVQ